MALELVPGALDGVKGTVRYPEAFDVSHLSEAGAPSDPRYPLITRPPRTRLQVLGLDSRGGSELDATTPI